MNRDKRNRSAWLAGLAGTALLLAAARLTAADALVKPGNAWVDSHDQRYALDDPFTKLTDNHGDGFEPLYGTRNVRMILRGVAYRGGANNRWNREGRRDNRNPLPDNGLASLCEEGFDRAYYLYRTNYATAPGTTRCEAGAGGEGLLDYRQASPFDEQHTFVMLSDIHSRIVERDRAPVYLHCWNGWHASGLIAAKALRQFCGYSAEDAVRYWDRNTDGHNTEPRYERIRSRIRAFEAYPELAISDAQASRVCP